MEIYQLIRPEGFTIFIYIVADNPAVVISKRLAALNEEGKISLIVHPKNRGASAARNTGIRAGKSKWILLLDDDIQPAKDLLIQYAGAIRQYESSIGFVGLTRFPTPFNAVTKALETGGWTSHFTAAEKYLQMRWAPTANILLNRDKLEPGLFDEDLKKSGEDIDFLVRCSLLWKEQYKSLPEALVFHPWWDGGKVQTNRMLRYGAGSSEISRKSPISEFTFRDFTNTSESLLIMLLLLPFAIIGGFTLQLLTLSVSVIFAELLTCWIKGILIGNTFSPLVTFHIFWAKNCYEGAFLIRSLQMGFWNGFALRTDMGFQKMHPSPFRTNRWKIIKMILIAVIFLIAVVAF